MYMRERRIEKYHSKAYFLYFIGMNIFLFLLTVCWGVDESNNGIVIIVTFVLFVGSLFGRFVVSILLHVYFVVCP